MDETQYDLKKLSPGSFSPSVVGGMAVDSFLDMLYARSGIPASHSKRQDLKTLHSSNMSNAARLPEVFPPADYTGSLCYTQDWIDCIASVDTSERKGVPPVTQLTPQAPDPGTLPVQPYTATALTLADGTTAVLMPTSAFTPSNVIVSEEAPADGSPVITAAPVVLDSRGVTDSLLGGETDAAANEHQE